MNQTVDKQTWFDTWGCKVFPIPSKLRLEKGSRQYYQARALTVMIIMITFNAFMALNIMVAIHFLKEGNDFTENIYTTLSVFMVMSVQVFCFYHFANIRATAVALSMSYFFMVSGIVIASGGYDSPSLMLLITCPIISFRLAGKDDGVMNAFFVGLAGFVLIFIDQQGFVLENHLDDLSEHVALAITWGISIVIIVSCLLVYDIDRIET